MGMTGKWLLGLGLCLLVSRGAWAASADAKDRAALKACLSGDYAKGVALLTELFVDSKDATYIYNQGRCYEQNRRYDDAIASFQEYLRAAKKLRKEEKVDAENHIADCEALLAKQSAQAVASRPAENSLPAPGQPVLPSPAPVALPVASVQQQPVSPAGTSGLRTAGIITAAVGAAVVAAGVLLDLKVNRMADSMEETDGYTPSRESERKTYQTLGWTSYGLGAACVATGVVLYLLGGPSKSPSGVAVVPAPGAGHAGAALEGTF